MIPARSILYALILIFFVTSSCGLLMAFNYLSTQQQTDQIQKENALNNLNSGISLLKSGWGTAAGEWHDLYDRGNDLVYLQQYEWGLLKIGIVKVTYPWLNLRDTLHKVMCLGEAEPQSLQSALFLKEQNVPLAVAGNTEIRGDAFLPIQGIRRTAINGDGFQGTQLIDGKQLKSTYALPPMDMTRLNHILDQVNQSGDSTITTAQLKRSFSETPLFIKGKKLTLDQVNLSGQIMVVATGEVHITAAAQLDQIIILANKIKIAEGFSGRIQAFATSTLEVAEHCQFSYPSVLGLLRTDAAAKKDALILKEFSTLQGLAFIKEMKPLAYPALLKIEPNASITGQVWTEGQTELRGTVIGNLSTESFLLNLGGASYVNHLFHARIDRNSLHPSYVHVLTGEQPEVMTLIEWLE